MKKHFRYLIILLAVFLIPITVKGTNVTDKLYIDIKIEEDGSLFIREIATLSGKYNGRLRDLQYSNPTAGHFTGIASDFAGSDIYNGSTITDLKVYDIADKYNLNFSSMDNLNKEYKLVNAGDSLDYGLYTSNVTEVGVNLKIFNPSSKNTAFYIEYRVKDAVVVHNDVAELAWNILGDAYQEDVYDFSVQVHLPKEDENLKVWLHGPLYGTIERTNSSLATVKYSNLEAYQPVSVRLMFDKSLVKNATKKSNIMGQDYILKYEQNQADIANAKREEEYAKVLQLAHSYLIEAEQNLDLEAYKLAENYINILKDSKEKTDLLAKLPRVRDLIEVKLEADASISLETARKHKTESNLKDAAYRISLLKEGTTKNAVLNEFTKVEKLVNDHLAIIKSTIYIITIFWGGLIIFIISFIKNKYNKSIKSEFNGEYYRDFPAEYGPGILEYLMTKKVSTLTFSATILDLIRKKIISFEELSTKKKGKDYLFTRKEIELELTEAEIKILELLFNIIGTDNKVTLNQIKDYGNTETKAREFMNKYREFNSIVTNSALAEDFYIKNIKEKTMGILILIIGGIILILLSFSYNLSILPIIIIFIIIICVIYISALSYRNIYGKTQYEMWNAHKRFLLDFGRFQEKDLPSVALWERYLVTATILGCAKQVQKSMQIHLTNMESLSDNDSIYGDIMTIHMMNHLLNADIANVVASTVSSAVNVSNSTIATANSTASSGGGFGGGASGGGGSFGGGGGGGRF